MIFSYTITSCYFILSLGGYADDNDYIVALWSILEEFNDTKRRKFLKFVTSCSRPPLLGFKVCNYFSKSQDSNSTPYVEIVN